MSLIKKCDVKRYFATHPRKGRLPLRSVKKLGAMGLVPGSSTEHSSSAAVVTPVVTLDKTATVSESATASNSRK